jgi:Family of unknown function (DUF5317)
LAFQAMVILTGIIVGWIKKGSIWSIVHIRLKAIWFLPIAYILQHVSIAYLNGTMYELIIVFSYISVILFCLMNLKVPGLLWTFVGTVANFAVMMANGLRMPAYVPAVMRLSPRTVQFLLKGDYGKSVAMSGHTQLNFLGDIFSFEIQPASLISVGDILFAIGLVIFIQHAMRVERRDNQYVGPAEATY